jgi:hypothetical protein
MHSAPSPSKLKTSLTTAAVVYLHTKGVPNPDPTNIETTLQLLTAKFPRNTADAPVVKSGIGVPHANARDDSGSSNVKKDSGVRGYVNVKSGSGRDSDKDKNIRPDGSNLVKDKGMGRIRGGSRSGVDASSNPAGDMNNIRYGYDAYYHIYAHRHTMFMMHIIICMYVNIYVHTYTHTHSSSRPMAPQCACPRPRTHTHACIYIYVHTYTHTHMHTAPVDQWLRSVPVQDHIYIYMYIYIYMHISC